jgi:hypothetical protein
MVETYLDEIVSGFFSGFRHFSAVKILQRSFKALDHSAALPVVFKGFIRLECAQTQKPNCRG